MPRYEQPTYSIINRGPGYEVRHYPAHLVAETVVDGDLASTGNTAFRRLAGFIFGRNSEDTRMNMTVPVTVQAAGNRRYRYRFMLERRYSAETVPRPLDGSVSVVTVPAGHYAAGTYRGGRTERRFRQAESDLQAALRRAGIHPVGPAELAVYSGPATPPFLRRNEVLVPVDEA